MKAQKVITYRWAFGGKLPCPMDTDGDGGCWNRNCPWCGNYTIWRKVK